MFGLVRIKPPTPCNPLRVASFMTEPLRTSLPFRLESSRASPPFSAELCRNLHPFSGELRRTQCAFRCRALTNASTLLGSNLCSPWVPFSGVPRRRQPIDSILMPAICKGICDQTGRQNCGLFWRDSCRYSDILCIPPNRP